MWLLLAAQWGNYIPVFGETGRTVASRLSFWGVWEASLGGQLPLRDVILFGSVAVFWVYLTTKILEARKWG